MFNKNKCCDVKTENTDLIEEEIEKLKKMYQNDPKTLIKTLDESINNLIIMVIAYWRVYTVLRTDIIETVTRLISIRPFIINQNSNISGNNH